MTDEKGYLAGWSNYATYCIHLWLTSDDEPYKYWTNLAQKLLNEQERPASHLRDALHAQISDAMPPLDGMWCDLMVNTLEEVNWQEIAEAFLKDKEKEDD